MRIRLILIIYILSSISLSCTRTHNPQLETIASIVSEHPVEALDSLSKIDYTGLSESDRHYYDFLSIKASDKAYIEHKSDSLVLDVIEYYGKRQDNPIYPETVYYGGRVYSDLGDYPTALKYFQSALELLPEDTDNQDLRASVLSQTGRLLNSLRLYSQAIPYIESTIEIDKALDSKVNEVYDIQLLGTVYLRRHDYESAERYFKEALYKSKDMPQQIKSKMAMYVAITKLRLGQVDSALIYIRNTPELVHPAARNGALAYATEIYLDAGIKDTAYIYAKQLIESPDFINKRIGYLKLLSPSLKEYTSTDSVREYAFTYGQALEEYLNENENQLAINQQSLYNYQLHERIKAETEKTNRRLVVYIFSAILLLLIMAIIIFILKIKNKNNIIELHRALENVGKLEKILNSKEPCYEKEARNDSDNQDTVEITESVNTLRDTLRNRLLDLYNSHSSSISVDEEILQSDAYNKLQQYIKDHRAIKDDDALWDELETAVMKCSHRFKENLKLLVGGRLTFYDLHTSLLIKCGVSPTEMTILLNRAKGTIVSRRESLCYRIFDKKLGTKVIDGVIRLL